jgi:SAM-dependent methyltransferase
MFNVKENEMNKNMLEKIGLNDLKEFVNEWALFSDIDKKTAYDLAHNSVRFYKNNKNAIKTFQEVEDRWYKSLEENKPDYSIYNDKYLLADIWACWAVYSRRYLKSINYEKSLTDATYDISFESKSIVQDMGHVSSVIDLGCGFGYTTATLKQFFHGAQVYGTNIEGTVQWNLAKHFGEKYGFRLTPNVQTLNKQIDLVFASEYFEHIENAVEHLVEVIDVCDPKMFVFANAFGTQCLGHFINHKHGNQSISAKDTSKLFNITLKEKGYKKIKTRCWNQRPTYWKKINN